MRSKQGAKGNCPCFDPLKGNDETHTLRGLRGPLAATAGLPTRSPFFVPPSLPTTLYFSLCRSIFLSTKKSKAFEALAASSGLFALSFPSLSSLLSFRLFTSPSSLVYHFICWNHTNQLLIRFGMPRTGWLGMVWQMLLHSLLAVGKDHFIMISNMF